VADRAGGGRGDAARCLRTGSRPCQRPAILSGAPAGSTTTTGTTAITIVNFKFAPTPVTVKAGTAVEWTNRDGVAHAVDFSVPDLHSSLLNSSDHFEHTFATPGSYAYICRIHPFMHGTLVVTT